MQPNGTTVGLSRQAFQLLVKPNLSAKADGISGWWRIPPENTTRQDAQRNSSLDYGPLNLRLLSRLQFQGHIMIFPGLSRRGNCFKDGNSVQSYPCSVRRLVTLRIRPIPQVLPYATRGKQKKQRPLAYPRQHPEELRPISRKLLQ